MKTAQKIPTIKEFLGNLDLGFSFIQKAGEQLVKMKAANFDVFDDILEECDWLTRDMLETILLIGRREIHPRILLLPRHVYTKIVGLPYEEQERIATQGVAVPVEPTVAREANLRREEAELFKNAKDLSRAESARVWGGHNKQEFTPASPKMELKLNGESVELAPASATNRKPQVITLGADGTAVVVFRKRVK